MAQDQTSLFNLALTAIGARKLVSAPSENSREAEICRLWYDPVRRHVFRAAHWPALKKFSRLALIAERVNGVAWTALDPEPGWTYVYAAPGDMVCPRHQSDYGRFTTGVYDASHQFAIFTDTSDVILSYTADVTDLSLWDADLYMAVAYGLAAHIAMPVTGKASRTDFVLSVANEKITQARITSANEEERHRDSLPEWITARGYSGGAGADRYIHPYGNLLVMPGASVE